MAMKMVALLIALLVFVINPTSSSNAGADPPESDLRYPDSLREKMIGIGGGLKMKCPKILKENMAERVVERVNASAIVKTVLRKSAVFVDCVAGKFCYCLNFRVEPVVLGCFGAVGAVCMERAVVGPVFECTLSCVKDMVMNGDPKLDLHAIGDLCYGKCKKN